MLATHLKAKGASSSSTNDSTNTNTTNNHNHTSFAQGYSNPNSNNSNGDQETNPQSMSARLSAGMMPYFIPPPPPGASHPSRGAGGSGYSDDTSNNNNDSVLDLMTPPMSPTDHSFDFAATINSRFDAATTLSSSSSSTSTSAHHQYHHQHHQPSAFALDEPSYSPRTDRTNRTDKTDRTLLSALGTSSPASSGFSSVVSPRPVSFHWDDYQSLEEDQDDSSDQDDFDYKTRFRHHRPPRQEKYPQKYQNYESDEDDDELEVRSTEADEDDEDRMRRAYQRQFEGHHSLVRRRSSFGGRGNGGGRGGDSYSEDSKYDSVRHGIGQNVSDVSEELAKARMAMNRASLAMRTMEAELKAMQLSIDESKASSASARSAIEENFWRLECLALTLEKDKQDMNKQLQAVGKDTHQAVETVTNWEVRIDWLERRVENTSEYVSELVLSEQECMSFIKMIIQQNQRYAMPAISKATERNIKLMAPPKQRVISPSPMRPMSPAPTHSIQPSPSPPPPPFASARVGHIPISWLLEPILPPRPPDLSSARVTELHESANSSDSSSNRNADPPAEFWRDFSRLTRAFETGQQRTPFSPFQRTRTRSASQGYGSSSANFQQGSSSSSNNITSTSGVGSGGNSLFKQAMVRRPQVEALSPMPKILPPAVSATKMANPKRRSQNLAHLPVHSWLQFQFNKTMTTPGPLGKKKKTNVLGFQPITIFQTTTDGLPFVPRHGTSIKR